MIFRAAIDAVGARRLVAAALARPLFEPLSATGTVRLVAAGKGAAFMARAFLDHWPGPVRAGLVAGTHCPVALPPNVIWRRAGHPVPDEDSVAAGAAALSMAHDGDGDEPLVVLLSGGASALLCAPVAGVSLTEKREVTARLLHGGADIHALNVVRKHLSTVKGGWLAARPGGMTLALVVSDVVGDDPSVIASGPTVADPTTFRDALEVLDRFGGRGAFPIHAVRHLERGAAGEVPETPKPGDPRLARATTVVIGSRHDAMTGAARCAHALGYSVVLIDEPVVGEAREAAAAHVARLPLRTRGLAGPVCVISSGETTVTVRGHGRGGRNQEFALACAGTLGTLGRIAVVASLGTDGVDGPTDAAGALADHTTLVRAAQAGLADPAVYLAQNDSYVFFDALGDLIRLGRTDTNVGDLQVTLIGEQ